MTINNRIALMNMIMTHGTPETMENLLEYTDGTLRFENNHKKTTFTSKGVMKNIIAGKLPAKEVLPVIGQTIFASELGLLDSNSVCMNLLEYNSLNVCILVAGEAVGVCLSKEFDDTMDLIMNRAA